jgi:hypothetical protein
LSFYLNNSLSLYFNNSLSFYLNNSFLTIVYPSFSKRFNLIIKPYISLFF